MPGPRKELHNKARGEVMLVIDGRARRLCLTLGALAELEAAFDAVSLAELAERMSVLTASDLITVLAALSAGGGEAMTSAELAAAEIEPKEAVLAIAAAFQGALGDG
jgi:hypothetical protein